MTAGICGACVTRVSVGQVDQSDIPDLTFTLDQKEIDQGMALICMSRAKTDVTLETQCDWGYSLGGIAGWQVRLTLAETFHNFSPNLCNFL